LSADFTVAMVGVSWKEAGEGGRLKACPELVEGSDFRWSGVFA